METKLILLWACVLTLAFDSIDAAGCSSERVSCAEDPTKEHQFPSAVSVKFDDRHECTGALIDEVADGARIITKTSCVINGGDLRSNIKLMYDTCDSQAGQVAEYVDPSTVDVQNDITILSFKGFDFRDDICPFVDISDTYVRSKKTIYVTGFRKVWTDGRAHLTEVELKVVRFAECQADYPHASVGDYFCADWLQSTKPEDKECLVEDGALAQIKVKSEYVLVGLMEKSDKICFDGKKFLFSRLNNINIGKN